MTTDKRISVTKAASQLGIPESFIRETIKPLYPDSWETIKSIKVSHFDSIAEALRDFAETPKSFEIEGDHDFYFGLEVDLENAAPASPLQGFYCNLPSEITVAEPDDLTTQEVQQLKVSVVRTFSDIAIDLNQITNALAYSSALKSFSSFKEIHSATFRHYTDQYIDDFGIEYQQMLNDLEVQCSPKDFLKERGIITS
jgi:hypothetical protein